MRKCFYSILVVLFIFFNVQFGHSADQVETLTFQWDQPDLTLVEDWELHWGNAASGPYVEAAKFVYQGGTDLTYEGSKELI